MTNYLKSNKLIAFAALAFFFFCGARLHAQVDFKPVFTTLRLEARADFDVNSIDNSLSYGFTGRYFNLHIGGNLNDKFTYYFRQRIVANPGSVSMFDNTDFLYLNYNPSKQWTFRLGKDALAVGGFEYDAPPINVLFNSYYWGVFYCFQLAATAAYNFSDGNQTVIAQVGNSPYIHYGSQYDNSLLSYNFFWSGRFGHFRTLYSCNFFQRDPDHFMNYIALGHEVEYEKWDLYVDFIHHANSTTQLFKNYGIISCANAYFNPNFSIFVKGGFEQNQDADEMSYFQLTGKSWDCLAVPGQNYTFAGIGFEIRPKACHDVRIHGFVADFKANQYIAATALHPAIENNSHNVNANLGITWDMNILQQLHRK